MTLEPVEKTTEIRSFDGSRRGHCPAGQLVKSLLADATLFDVGLDSLALLVVEAITEHPLQSGDVEARTRVPRADHDRSSDVGSTSIDESSRPRAIDSSPLLASTLRRTEASANPQKTRLIHQKARGNGLATAKRPQLKTGTPRLTVDRRVETLGVTSTEVRTTLEGDFQDDWAISSGASVGSSESGNGN